ncbi:MAG: hypothetical protein J5643_07380 [Lachnospiraceae bacterium]|nr:hypothetical protein [Lachnospiraceae bacterium]
MSNLEIVLTILTVVSSLCAIVFGYDKFRRSQKKDDIEEGKNTGSIMTDLGEIKSGVNDIKAEQREQRKMNLEFVERLVKVETSDTSAHEKIAALQTMINK